MKSILALAALAVAGLLATSPQSTQVSQTTMAEFPGIDITDMVRSPNGRFIYFGDGVVLRLYDRILQRTTELLKRDAFYVTISKRGDLLAFASEDETSGKTYAYTLPLDATTGLATGPARRVTADEGDTPSISPDGKWIAYADFGPPTSPGQRLGLVPASGGPPRLLAEHPEGGIEPIRWSADGKSITYGADVTTYRISASGGTPVVVAKGTDVYPGASPDGRLIVVNTSDADNGVFDSTGKLLGTYQSRDDRYSYEWSSPSKILAVVWTNRTALHARSLTSGRTTPVKIATENIAEPRWSPDGKRVAFARRSTGPKWDIIVMNPDGSGARTCPVPGRFLGLSWSPDGQRIAYRANDSTAGALAAGEVGAVDAASCAYTRVARGRLGAPRWTRDSKRIHVAELVDTSSNAATKYRWQLFERTLAGAGRILADGSSASPPFHGTNDTTALLLDTPDGDVLVGLTDGGKRRVLFPRGPRHSVPTFSLDGHWMAIRSGPQGAFNTLHVLRTDGSEQATIDLPFTAIAGAGNPIFLPGNRELIALGTHPSSDSVAYYRVNVATKTVSRILTAGKAMGRNGPEFTVSPDGSTLLYSTRNPPHSSIVELDLSMFLNRLR